MELSLRACGYEEESPFTPKGSVYNNDGKMMHYGVFVLQLNEPYKV